MNRPDLLYGIDTLFSPAPDHDASHSKTRRAGAEGLPATLTVSMAITGGRTPAKYACNAQQISARFPVWSP